jgi:peptidoglycan/LPS O-acetylase OafA/YrhL
MLGNEKLRSYLPWFDVLRVLSSFGIVAFHLGTGWLQTIGYVGLIVFLLMMFILIAQGARTDQVLAKLAIARAKRLLVPWLAWYCVYLVVALRLDLLVFDRQLVVAGPSIHLWFLPYAFIASLGAHFLLRTPSRLTDAQRVFLLGSVGVLFLGFLPKLVPIVGAWPLGEWWVATPSLFLGLAMGLTTKMADRVRLMALGAIAAGTILAGAMSLDGENSTAAYAYMGATVLVPASMLLRGRPSRPIAVLVALTFGVYLVHPLVSLVFVKFFDASTDLSRITLVFLASCVVISVIRSSKWGRLVT